MKLLYKYHIRSRAKVTFWNVFIRLRCSLNSWLACYIIHKLIYIHINKLSIHIWTSSKNVYQRNAVICKFILASLAPPCPLNILYIHTYINAHNKYIYTLYSCWVRRHMYKYLPKGLISLTKRCREGEKKKKIISQQQQERERKWKRDISRGGACVQDQTCMSRCMHFAALSAFMVERCKRSQCVSFRAHTRIYVHTCFIAPVLGAHTYIHLYTYVYKCISMCICIYIYSFELTSVRWPPRQSTEDSSRNRRAMRLRPVYQWTKYIYIYTRVYIYRYNHVAWLRMGPQGRSPPLSRCPNIHLHL